MDRTYTIEELLAAVRRRWKTAALVAGGLLVLAALVILRLPNEYRARALVMVEPFTPHPDLVVPVINAQSLEEKVKSVRSSVYARGLMATAIEELDLYPKARKKSMDEAIESLRADTEVHPEGENAFAIVVRGKDPETAAKAANRLAELYIEGNLQVRAGQVTRTRDIIGQKLAELRGELAKAQQKVNAYKQSHAEELPELLEARYHQRDQIAKAIEQESSFAQEAQRRIDLLGTQPFGKDTEVGRAEEQVDEMKARLAKLNVVLTPDHPDVVSARRELDSAQGRLQAARARAAANDLELRRMTAAIQRSEKRVEGLQKQQAQLDKMIAGTPLVTAQLTDLNKDVEYLGAKVASLTSKKAEAEITADLEQKSGPSEFRVLESAQPPALAAAPNRPQLLLLALLGALALGCALAVSQELSDRSLRTEGEAGSTLALPVLACVPELGGKYDLRVLPAPAQAEA